MKITASITGQDQRRLVERIERLLHARIANAQPAAAQDTPPTASPPTRRQQRSNSRS